MRTVSYYAAVIIFILKYCSVYQAVDNCWLFLFFILNNRKFQLLQITHGIHFSYQSGSTEGDECGPYPCFAFLSQYLNFQCPFQNHLKLLFYSYTRMQFLLEKNQKIQRTKKQKSKTTYNFTIRCQHFWYMPVETFSPFMSEFIVCMQWVQRLRLGR